MRTKKVTPWNKIKAEYLQGCTPKELAEKYNLKAKSIINKASADKWTEEKRTISDNLRQNVQERIKSLTDLALAELEGVLKDREASNGDKISAAKVIVDISGLKSSKNEIEINKEAIKVEFI